MSNNTSCKDCIFAKYNEITQEGCSRGMIEKYLKLGTSVIEAYDHDKEFYVIENRICPLHRTQAWADRIEDEDAMDRMIEYESKLLFHVMVFMQDSLEDVQETLASLILQNQLPFQATIIRPRNSIIEPRTVLDLFSDLTPFQWRLENLWLPMPQSTAIHMVQKVAKSSNYYTVCQAGYRYDPWYFSTINEAVTKELLQFAMIEEPKDEGSVVIPLAVHEYWHFHGNHDLTIPENIREFQCENQEKKIVFTMDQIRESLQQGC